MHCVHRTDTTQSSYRTSIILAVPFIVIVKIVITDIYRDRQEMKGGEPTI